MTEHRTGAWLLLVYGDQRSYAGNVGYTDELQTVYKYDSFVQNHKQIREGDIAVLQDRTGLVGLARIARVVESKGTKTRLRCPSCRSTALKTRKMKKPPMFCASCKHEFENAIQEEVDCTNFSAFFGDSFIPARGAIGVADLRDACPTYSGQLSMQPISTEPLLRGLRKTTPAVTNLFSSGAGHPLPFPLEPEEGDDLAHNPNITDEQEKVLRTIRRRRGQCAFRDALRARYHDQCVVTGCTLVDVLEAAHISPYRRVADNHPSNGLLLRADIHTLFDLYLLTIEPTKLRVHLHPDARKAYPMLHEADTALTKDCAPNEEALLERWREFTACGGQEL